MSAHGAGRLHICEGSMEKTQYLQVLQSRAVPQMASWFPESSGIFMHDSAPCHRAKICAEFLHQKGITVLDWPGNSPDLNPIETLWAIVKSRLSKESLMTKNELIAALIKVWHRDSSVTDTCKRLVEQMPQRIRAVIEAKGGNTRY